MHNQDTKRMFITGLTAALRLPAAILCFGFVVGLTHARAQDLSSFDSCRPHVPTAGNSSSGSLILRPGDVIEVTVFNTPELSARHQVGQDGMIKIPGTSDIKVAGLTAQAAATQIECSLKESEIMLDPHVTVLDVQHVAQEISVLGEVGHPGTFPFLDSENLLSALAAAGGVTAKAGSTITITHVDDPDHPVVVPVDAKSPAGDRPMLPLRPSDVILVSQAEIIYVVGDVDRPGQFSLTNSQHPLKALEALALAQGSKDTASASKASIIRTNPAGGIETIPVDLPKIAKNQAPDPVMQPYDVLVVPHSGLKTFAITALPGLTTAAANAVLFALIN